MYRIKRLTLASGGAGVLVDDGHDVVGWVGDDGTEDTSDVTGGEGDHQLLGLNNKVIVDTIQVGGDIALW